MDDERDELGQPKNRPLPPEAGAFSLLLVAATPTRRGSRRRRDPLLYVDHDKGEAVDTTDEGEDAEELARESANASRLRRTNSSAAVRRRRSIAPTT